MSVIESSGQPRRIGRVWDWMNHHSVGVGFAAIAVTYGTDVVTDTHLPWMHNNPVLTVVGLLALAVMIIMSFKAPTHGIRPCSRCFWRMITEDGSMMAATRLKTLRMFHRFTRRAAITYFVVIVGLSFDNVFLGHVLGDIASAVGAAVICTSNFLVIRMGQVHHRYQQWCPWCRGRDDDDDYEVEPTPVPGESIKTKTG